MVAGTVDADADLRHCLTLVAGYLGLLLDEQAMLTPDQRAWTQRAAQASQRAISLLDTAPAPRPVPSSHSVGEPAGVTQR